MNQTYPKQKVNYMQVGRTVECSECFPSKGYYSCQKVEQEYGIKCKCICHQPEQCEKYDKCLRIKGHRGYCNKFVDEDKPKCSNCGKDQVVALSPSLDPKKRELCYDCAEEVIHKPE